MSEIPTRIQIRPAPDDGLPCLRGMRYQITLVFLSGGTILLSTFCFPIFGYTFWVMLEMLIRFAHLRHGFGLLTTLFDFTNGVQGWDVDAAVLLGLLSSLSVFYLLNDSLAMYRNQRAYRLLRRRAERLIKTPPSTAFFVELNIPKGTPRIQSEVGWLFLFPDLLFFVGDTITLRIPRTEIAGVPSHRFNLFHLGASCLRLELCNPWERISLLCLGKSNRLSETVPGTMEMERVLRNWLSTVG